MMNLKNVLRCASVAAAVFAGSCAAPFNDDSGLTNDPQVNHPITVQPYYSSIKVDFTTASAGLTPDDAARLDGFVTDYLARGNGSISVSAPAGPGSAVALTYFGERLFQMGVPRSSILVGTHDAASGGKVVIGFIAYTAHTDPCGNWSKNLGESWGNRTSPNFGCANQQNLAAEVSDPRDLIQPRAMEPSDAQRRTAVMENYEQGKVTSAAKTQAQTANVSDVGGSGGP